MRLRAITAEVVIVKGGNLAFQQREFISRRGFLELTLQRIVDGPGALLVQSFRRRGRQGVRLDDLLDFGSDQFDLPLVCLKR